MTKKLLSFLVILFPFTFLLFGIQFFVIEELKSEVNTFNYSTWSVYTFHFFATLLVYLFILFVAKTFPDKVGFAFMASSLLKMMAAIVFLLPLIINKEMSAINDVFAFFIPYFLFLSFETFFALKILNMK